MSDLIKEKSREFCEGDICTCFDCKYGMLAGCHGNPHRLICEITGEEEEANKTCVYAVKRFSD